MSAQILMTVGPGDSVASERAVSSAQTDALFDLARLAPGLVSADIASVVIDPVWVASVSQQKQTAEAATAPAVPDTIPSALAAPDSTAIPVADLSTAKGAMPAPALTPVIASTPEADRLLSDALMALAALEQTGRRGVSGQKPDAGSLPPELKLRVLAPSPADRTEITHSSVEPFALPIKTDLSAPPASSRKEAGRSERPYAMPDQTPEWAGPVSPAPYEETPSVDVIDRESLRATSPVSLPLLMNDLEFITTPITFPPLAPGDSSTATLSQSPTFARPALAVTDSHGNETAIPVGELVETPRTLILPNRPMPVTPASPLHEPVTTEPAPALLFDTESLASKKRVQPIDTSVPASSTSSSPSQETNSHAPLLHDHIKRSASMPVIIDEGVKEDVIIEGKTISEKDSDLKPVQTDQRDHSEPHNRIDHAVAATLIMTAAFPSVIASTALPEKDPVLPSNVSNSAYQIVAEAPVARTEQASGTDIHPTQTVTSFVNPTQDVDEASVPQTFVVPARDPHAQAVGDVSPAILPQRLGPDRDGSLEAQRIMPDAPSLSTELPKKIIDQSPLNIIRDAPAPSAIKTTRDQDEITPPTETIVKEQPSAYATRAWTPMPLPKTEEVITPPIQTMLKDQPSAYETGASSPLPLSTANTSLAPSFSPLTHTETVTKDWPRNDRTASDDSAILPHEAAEERRLDRGQPAAPHRERASDSPRPSPASSSRDVMPRIVDESLTGDRLAKATNDAAPQIRDALTSDRAALDMLVKSAERVVLSPRVNSVRVVKPGEKISVAAKTTEGNDLFDHNDVIATEERPIVPQTVAAKTIEPQRSPSEGRHDLAQDLDPSLTEPMVVTERAPDRRETRDTTNLARQGTNDGPIDTAASPKSAGPSLPDPVSASRHHLSVTTAAADPSLPPRDGAGAPVTESRPSTRGFEMQRARQFEMQLIAAVKAGREEVHISLYPAQLGQVTLNLALEGQKVKVSLKTNNREASDLLNAERPLLSQALSREGFSLEGFDVTEDDSHRNRKTAEPTPVHTPVPPSSGGSEFFIDITI